MDWNNDERRRPSGRLRGPIALWLVGGGLTACGGGGACGSFGAVDPAVPANSDPANLAPTRPEESAGTATPRREAPNVRLRSESTRRERTLVIENRSRETVSLKSSVSVLPEGADAEVATLTLAQDCEQDVPDCIALVPGAELRPPPWEAGAGESQCACDSCEPVPAGSYLFRVEACDGSYALRSPHVAID